MPYYINVFISASGKLTHDTAEMSSQAAIEAVAFEIAYNKAPRVYSHTIFDDGDTLEKLNLRREINAELEEIKRVDLEDRKELILSSCKAFNEKSNIVQFRR